MEAPSDPPSTSRTSIPPAAGGPGIGAWGGGVSPSAEVRTGSAAALGRRGWRCCCAAGPADGAGISPGTGHARAPCPGAPAWKRPHQQAEGVLDFLKHVDVLVLGGRLRPQRQEALCGWGRRARRWSGDRSGMVREAGPQWDRDGESGLVGGPRGGARERARIGEWPWLPRTRSRAPLPPAARRRFLRPRSRCSRTRAASADFCSLDTKLSTSSNTWFRMSWGAKSPGPSAPQMKPSRQERQDTLPGQATPPMCDPASAHTSRSATTPEKHLRCRTP